MSELALLHYSMHGDAPQSVGVTIDVSLPPKRELTVRICR